MLFYVLVASAYMQLYSIYFILFLCSHVSWDWERRMRGEEKGQAQAGRCLVKAFILTGLTSQTSFVS